MKGSSNLRLATNGEMAVKLSLYIHVEVGVSQGSYVLELANFDVYSSLLPGEWLHQCHLGIPGFVPNVNPFHPHNPNTNYPIHGTLDLTNSRTWT
eukprot:534954-Ditylum_brightwellii.AAC.1